MHNLHLYDSLRCPPQLLRVEPEHGPYLLLHAGVRPHDAACKGPLPKCDTAAARNWWNEERHISNKQCSCGARTGGRAMRAYLSCFCLMHSLPSPSLRRYQQLRRQLSLWRRRRSPVLPERSTTCRMFAPSKHLTSSALCCTSGHASIVQEPLWLPKRVTHHLKNVRTDVSR